MSDFPQADVFRSYVPRLILQRLESESAAEALPSSERFGAALLFVDIKGFTPLTERFDRMGPAGAETLARLLDSYFGQLVEMIEAYGGDVLEFAGDALLALWRQDDEDLERKVMRAAGCALAIQADLNNYAAADDLTLNLRVSVAAGEVLAMYLSGRYQRREFLLAGAPLGQLAQGQALAGSGELILSGEAAELCREGLLEGEILDGGALRLRSLKAELAPRGLPPLKAVSPADAALREFIPPVIEERLKAGHSAWLAEFRRISVVFVGLRGLDYDAPDIVDRVQEVFTASQETLRRYEGHLHQFLVDDKGTVLLAAFGLPPLAHENDAELAVRAAGELRSLLEAKGIHSSIGITTGRIFCGPLGSATRRSYGILGDKVNLAARLMQAADKDICCDHATLRANEEQVAFAALPPLQLKGKSAEVAVFRPLADAPLEPVASPPAELVGRRQECAALDEYLQGAKREKRRAFVILEGEAGIGKTSLLRYARDRAGEFGMQHFNGGGNAIEKSTPYFAWRDILAQLFDLTASQGDAAARGQRVLRYLQDDGELLSLASLLNPILALDLAESPQTEHLRGRLRADKTQYLLSAIMQKATGKAPALLVLDDAQWLDSASWALLPRVCADVPALVLLLATRPLSDPLPDEYRRLRGSSSTHVVSVKALPAADSEELVRRRLGVDALPPPVAALIRSKAEGHPFFSEELAYALRDAGLIVIENGRCRMSGRGVDLADFDVPDTVEGVITSRIDRLPPEQQLMLKVASAIGRIFTLRILKDIYPILSDKPKLDDYLGTLERLDIAVLEAPPPELAYIFKHIITQEVAYKLMLFAQRRKLHRAIAEWYERHHNNDLSPYYAMLAHHWSQAIGSPELEAETADKAISYLRQAGEQAMRSSANVESITHLRKAIELQEKLPQSTERQRRELSMRIALGNAIMATKGYAAPEVVYTYARARELSQQVTDHEEQLPVLYGLFVYYLVRAEHKTCLSLGEEFLQVAEEHSDPALVVAHRALGWPLFSLGEIVRGRDHFEKILGLYQADKHQALTFRYGQDPGIAGRSCLSLALWVLGFPDKAREQNSASLLHSRELDHPFSLAYALVFAALVHHLRRETQLCHELAAEAMTLCREHGFAMWLAFATILHGWSFAAAGNTAKGMEQMRQGLEAFRNTGAEMLRPTFLALLAETCAGLNKSDEYRNLLNEARSAVDSTAERWYEAELLRLEGEMVLADGDESRAAEYFNKALALARRQQAKSWELRAALSQARLLHRQGRGDAARELLEEIYGRFDEGFTTMDLRDAKELLDRMTSA